MNIILPVLALFVTAANLCANAGPGPWASGNYYPGQLNGRYFANAYNNVGGTFSKASTTNTFFTTNQVTTTVISNAGIFPITTTVISNVVAGPFGTTNTVVTGSVVSGIISFGIRDGAPPFTPAPSSSSTTSFLGTTTTTSTSAALQQLALDRSLNNWLVYINGDVYIGSTSANINPDGGYISGVLANGAGRESYQLVTNRVTDTFFGIVTDLGVEVISLPSATANGFFNGKVKSSKSPYTFKGQGQITISTASATSGSSGVDGTHEFEIDGIKTSDNPASAYPTSSSTAPQQ